MKPGVTLAQLKDIAEEVYKKHGFGKEFLAFGRYIGHTMGISTHDVDPDRNRPLAAGVVYNVEPLIEIPDKKIHMRLEDTVLITPTGAVNMTVGAPPSAKSTHWFGRRHSALISELFACWSDQKNNW